MINDQVFDAEIVNAERKKGRRSDGGVYLVVADDTPEFLVALRYAAGLARANRGHVAILQVINIDDFQHWGSVEERMRRELREQAEKFIWNTAKTVNDWNGMLPSLYVEEGVRDEVLLAVINREENIRMLVLGAGTQGGGGPGTLVAHFTTSKGLAKLRVPVLVVPGHLDEAALSALSY